MRTPADDPDSARFATLSSWLLTQTAMHAGRIVHDRLAAVDARGYHYRLLTALDEFGPASQAALGRRSGIHFSDMVATINELADRRLVDRSPDTSDRRRNIITITRSGLEYLGLLDTVLADVQDELLAPLSASERKQLSRLLVRIRDHHTNAGPNPA